MNYKKRFADIELTRRLETAGAVLICGPKACGKTETALQIAKSHVRLDTDAQARLAMQVAPERVLQGHAPRLLDEWQEFPELWNLIRHEVDDKKQDGLYILAGSANPDEKTRRHSGAGRFSVMRMRPMSLFENGWSSGEVSLGQLFSAGDISSTHPAPSLDELAEKMLFGGWPGLLGKTLPRALEFSRDYAMLTAEVDISRVSEKRRDPDKVFRLMQSLARNVSTEVSVATLAADVRGGAGAFKEETAADYIGALERLMFLENLPAWNAHIRSSATLRQMPKRHFADPSLACGILRFDKTKLLSDLEYFGLLFESLVIRDLRIYAQAFGGKVRHYRDSSGLEVDAIVENETGDALAVEVKLGVAAADAAAANLIRFAKRLDTSKTPAPRALVVVTTNGFAHRRPDGVYVVPLTTLTA
jgi:predicted AAA+ superfamily ATPase